MTTILEAASGHDFWQILRDVGGSAGILFGIAIWALWREVKAKDIALAELNKQIQEDAKEGIRVMTSVENLLDKNNDIQQAGERRIIDSVNNATKQIIDSYKAHLASRASRGGGID